MEDFIHASQQIGKNIIYIQGAGGNISVKISNTLYIKASGYKLKHINESDGYVGVLYTSLAKYIFSKKTYKRKDEEEFIKKIADSTLPSQNNLHPSMEVGFHAVLPAKYVIHLHSVYANIFTCMKNGELYLHDIFKDYPNVFLPYTSPGYELAYLLSQKKTLPPLIFLQNHGIIIQGETIEQCALLIQKVHTKLEDYLEKNKVFKPFVLAKKYLQTSNYIFPDSAVFSNTNIASLSKNKKKELLEIMSAQQYIIDTINRLKKQPSFLTKKHVQKLITMQQEKYRQSVFKQ